MFRQAVVPILCAAIIIAALYLVVRSVKSEESVRRAAAAALERPGRPAEAKPAASRALHAGRAAALPEGALPGRKPVFRFPTAAEIPAGTRKTDLCAAFGQPSLTAATYDRATLSETIVYVRPDASAITYAWLTNGTVVRAATVVR